MNKKNYICPICGYDKLIYKPDSSYEICPCCGYEFGSFEYNNESLEKYFHDYQETHEVYNFIRNVWLGNNLEWWSKNNKKPKNWNPIKQLNNLNNYLFETNKKSGGFIEIQYCTKNLPLKDLLNIKNIDNWKEDSLFVEVSTQTEKLFNNFYEPLLKNANLANDAKGFDYYGINYYTKEQTISIYNQIKENINLPDRDVFLNWLQLAIKQFNGFYILGA